MRYVSGRFWWERCDSETLGSTNKRTEGHGIGYAIVKTASRVLWEAFGSAQELTGKI
jgi:hypothetical protein